MWRQNQGNVTVAVVGATAACMMIGLLFISIVGIYAANQSADTAAAAAAMGALRSLRDPILVAAEGETNRRIHQFWAEVDGEVSYRLQSWEDGYRLYRQIQLEGQEPPLTAAAIAAIIDGEVAALWPGRAEAYRVDAVTRRKPAIASQLLAGAPVAPDVRVREFLRPEDRGCLVYQVARANQGAMELAADRYADRNGAVSQQVQFRTTARLEVESRVQVRIRLALYDRLLPAERRHLTITGNAYLDNLVGQPLSFPAGCRKG